MDSRLAAITEVCRDLATSHVVVKLVGGFIALLLPLLFDQQLNQLYFAAGVLVSADFLTGLMVVWTVPGARIESRKVIKSFAKAFVYTIAFVSARQAEIMTGINELPLPWRVGIDEAILGYIGVHEFISVLENMERMGYKWAHNLINFMSKYKGPNRDWDKEHPKLSKRK